ncbi:unnamed protein product (macronuclear) [Paramecium tetraurelia]|uniref:ubiquitinyl hydrolase 1 n=1 Tax=Paramecium tetraurelia TaxID=5888 RepID=A0DKY3_PARTE|nr:uncharacterized protein GSPATT00018017001 [Paramecium tetraurelia]CAK83700.1 unnamed protein product [Paramecium tetraurelia]|eukprot:XP_001451097.1 hypothetical protein (macronuclear) [Paramecium tetraurelia strain d4-2]
MTSTCEHINEQHITWSVKGQMIYKNQCTRCFVEAKSENGIQVCLKCFNGGCIEIHSPQHSYQHNHYIVLNIRLYEIEQQKQSVDEITQQVIEDIPQLDFETSVICLKCQKMLNSPQLDGLIQSIKQTNATSFGLIIDEYTIQPCQHTLTIQQRQLVVKNLQKCRRCRLSTNLWLCLQCGHVGCGRKIFDGSGGNNHAVDHFVELQHHLVVKLGTITSDGQADVFCYKCDDAVVDKLLKEHLATYGIEIEKQVKTEKTMAELTQDKILVLQLSKLIEEGQVLDPIFGPGFTGIDNIGNTCYMNSVIQVIFSIHEFKQLYSLEHQFNCTSLPYNCVLCQICKVNHGLNSGEFSIKKESKNVQGTFRNFYQDGIKPYDFKLLVAQGNSNFLFNHQQDAQEYWQLLNSFFQKTEKQFKLPQLSSIFSYDQTTILKCENCGGHKVNVVKNQEFKVPVEQPTQDQIDLYRKQEKQKYEERIKTMKPEDIKPFSLKDIPEYVTTFERCLQLVKEGERVDIVCPSCQSLQSFIKQEYFKTFPKYLFVPVNRFVQENWVPKKLNASIKIKEIYDFSDFKEPVLQDKDAIKEQTEQEYTEDTLQILMGMGFGENRCKRALIKFKNDIEAAMIFIMKSLDDPTQDQPLKQKEQINEKFIEQIVIMGFSHDQARFALSKTDNDLKRAMDYIFNHDLEAEMNQTQAKQQQQKQDQFDNQTSKYQLFACIVHLGKSVQSGHYVSYIKKNGEWILYNDSKVAKIADPALNKGYMYIFKRLD